VGLPLARAARLLVSASDGRPYGTHLLRWPCHDSDSV
jgi:hypothetical protein